MEPMRILHMIGRLHLGGAQAMVINLYKAMDREKIQFDFIIDHPEDLQIELKDEVERLGAKVYIMPTYVGSNTGEVKRAWNSLFKEHPEYKILHSHMRGYASLYLPIAKKYGLKTIMHSHSTSNGKGFRAMTKRMLQYPLRFQADYFFGCSRVAGEWLFGKRIVNSGRYHLLNNAIDLDSYKQNQEVREEYRKNFGVADKKVFLHIGRINPAKNHIFLLDVFDRIYKDDKNAVLFIVGDGDEDLKKEIKNKISELKLEKAVVMTGSRTDAPKILQMADCFLFPSKWEGLPLAVVEAQAAGLPCLVSANITEEVLVSDLAHKLDIADAKVWSDTVKTLDFTKKDVTEDIKKAGFDINSSAAWLTDFYNDIIK